MGRSNRNDKKYTTKSKQLMKDFEKKKRKKLGVKLKPANATQIKFRSHSIHVTKQKLRSHQSQQKLRINLVQISLDIKEALSHLSHQKGKVRRDVLIELKTILSRIPIDTNLTNTQEERQRQENISLQNRNRLLFKAVLHENLVQLITIFELVYDHESIVRNALKNFMNWFMPRCKNSIALFGPFWSLILAHLSAGLSHIDTDVRFTAIRILRSFFSVGSKCHQYFTLSQSIVLLKHIHLLFNDIIRSGMFVVFDENNNHNNARRKHGHSHSVHQASMSMNHKQKRKLKKQQMQAKNSGGHNNQKKQPHSHSHSHSNGTKSSGHYYTKQMKSTSSQQEMQIVIHILCECTTHIVRILQRQMCNSRSTIETNLHALLLPSDTSLMSHSSAILQTNVTVDEMNHNNRNHNGHLNDGRHQNEFEIYLQSMDNNNIELFNILLSIFASCTLIFEQFAKNHKYSSVSMMITLCNAIANLLVSHPLKKILDARVFYLVSTMDTNTNTNTNTNAIKMNSDMNFELLLPIKRSLFVYFSLFPIEMNNDSIEFNANSNMNMHHNGNDNNNHNNNYKNKKQFKKLRFEHKQKKKLECIRYNLKIMRICLRFIDCWKLQSKTKKSYTGNSHNHQHRQQRPSNSNYFEICHQWLCHTLKVIANDHLLGILSKGDQRMRLELMHICQILSSSAHLNEHQRVAILHSINKLYSESAIIGQTLNISKQLH